MFAGASDVRHSAHTATMLRAREWIDTDGADAFDRRQLINDATVARSREGERTSEASVEVTARDEPEGEDGAADSKTGPAPSEKHEHSKVAFLDGLRGLAALMVVQQHLRYTPEIRLGSAAVDVFFTLSAFLLTMLFERKARHMLTRRAPATKWLAMLADYFSKRFFRVYPLLVVVALALQCMTPGQRGRFYLVDDPNYSAIDVLTFKPEARWFVLWSLPLEVAYYFFIPLLVAAVLAMRRLWWLAAIPAYVWIINEGIHTSRAHHQPLRPHLPTFVAGSLAAVIYSKIDEWIEVRSFDLSKWHRVAVRVVELALFAVFMSILFRGLLFHCCITDPYLDVDGFPFVSVPVSALIVIEMLLPSALARFLEWNFLRYAGRISFSIYLTHAFVIYQPSMSAVEYKYDRFFLHFGCVMLLATATYWTVEYPSQLAAQRVSKLLNRVTAPSTKSAMPSTPLKV